MASEMGWGGMPLMRPSSLATRYQLYERDIIPERRIEPGQRYRARKNLAEHVSSSPLSRPLRMLLSPKGCLIESHIHAAKNGVGVA